MGRREHAAAKGTGTRSQLQLPSLVDRRQLVGIHYRLAPFHQQSAANLMRIPSAAQDVAQAMTAQ